MLRHLSTRNISSKSMHAFLSNLANRQTNKQTNKQTQAKHVAPPLSEVKTSLYPGQTTGNNCKMPFSLHVANSVSNDYNF